MFPPVQERLTCPVCSKILNKPRILPSCSHALCLDCLNNITSGGSVVCPTCFNSSKAGLEVRDAVLDEVMEFVHDLDIGNLISSGFNQPCFQDPTHTAKVYCGQCKVWLCDKCLVEIHSKRAFEGHRSSLAPAHAAKPAYNCPQHATQQLDRCCESCQVLTCPKCATDHCLPGHSVSESLVSASAAAKKTCNECISEAAEIEKNLQTFLSSVRSVTARQQAVFDTATKQVSEAFDKVIAALTAKKQEVLTKMTDHHTKNSSLFRNAEAEATRTLSSVQTHRQLAELVVGSADDIQILKTHKQLTQQLQRDSTTATKRMGETPKELGFAPVLGWCEKALDAVNAADCKITLKGASTLFAVGGCSGKEFLATVEKYDWYRDKWMPLPPMPNKRAYHASAMLNDCLFVTGGENGNASRSILKFDPSSNLWSEVAPMATARLYHSAAVLGGELYVAGGCPLLNSVEKYDPVSNTWVAVAPLPVGVHYHRMAALNGFLYSTGGYTGQANIKNVYRYDPTSNTWTEVAPMNVQRSAHCVGVLKGSLVVAGGSDGGGFFSSVEKYDPVSNTWVLVASMKVPRSSCGAGVVNEQLFVAGGYGAGPLASAERYDDQHNEWRDVARMSSQRFNHTITQGDGTKFCTSSSEP